jgi:hypothetical protein
MQWCVERSSACWRVGCHLILAPSLVLFFSFFFTLSSFQVSMLAFSLFAPQAFDQLSDWAASGKPAAPASPKSA